MAQHRCGLEKSSPPLRRCHNGDVSDSPATIAPRPLDDDLVRTTLVHRRFHGSPRWWHTASVMEIPGLVDDVAMRMLRECMFPIARCGFTAVMLRPAMVSLLEKDPEFTALVDAAHRVGLKIIVRLSGADHRPWVPGENPASFIGCEGDTSRLIVRARTALTSGVDGIDMGRIEDAPQSSLAEQRASRFTSLTRLLHAELMEFDDDHILAATATVAHEDAYRRHLEEEWFHHLRDDRLAHAPFTAEALEDSVEAMLRERDRMGMVCAWKATRPRLVGTPGVAAAYAGSWEDEADDQRRAAMQLVLATLPGSIYVSFAAAGGHAEFDGMLVRPTPATTDEEKARAQHTTMTMRLRAEHQLAVGSFAIVRGLEWQRPGVSVVMAGAIMGVCNISGQTVEVPADHQLLLRSDSTRTEDTPITRVLINGEATIVTPRAQRESQNQMAPNTTAWFAPAHITGSQD